MVAEAIEIEIVNQELILVFESAVPGWPSGTVYRWGIAWNLSDQADLLAALQAKADIADLADVALSWLYSDLTGLPSLLALWETSSTAYRGDRGKDAYDHSQLITGNPHNTTKGDVWLGNVDNTSDVNKPVSTAQAVADAAILSSAQSYSDALVVGLRDDRWNFTPSWSYPTTGWSGPLWAIKKGDTYVIAWLWLWVTALVWSQTVADGDTVRATIDTPGQTDANRSIIENNLWYTAENKATKDQSGWYAWLTLFKINFKNALNTFTSFFTNSNTASRTYGFPDRDGTIADDTDLATKITKNSPITPGTSTKVQYDANGLVIAGTNATTDDISEWSTNLYFTAARVRSTVLTGLSLAAGTVVTAAHTILEAIGFLQNQVSTNTTAIATKVAKPAVATDNAIMLMNASWDVKTPSNQVTIDNFGNIWWACSSITTYTVLALTTIRLNPVADTVSGSNARMWFPNGQIRRLTNSWLVSVGAIPQWYGDGIIVIHNDTTNSITLINEDATQTAAERIITGTGWNYTLPHGGSVWAYYSVAKLRYQLISTN